MGIGTRRLTSILLALVMVFMLVPIGVGAPAPAESSDRPERPVTLSTNEPDVSRLAGDNRLETAASISQYGWDSSDLVVLAAKDRFPDALAGGPLAAQYDAPILLTDSAGLSDDARTEIERLGATRVLILGGEAAVGAGVVVDLIAAGIATEDIQRIGGADRYETAALIAFEMLALTEGVEQVVITTGAEFPDALGVAGVAGAFEWPVLFTRSGSLPQATQDALDATGGVSALVVGGESAVSPAVLAALPDGSIRVGGANRYETAALVAEYAFPRGGSYERVYLATGLDFPDALAIGPLAAREGSPILLTTPATLVPAADDFLNSHCSAIQSVFVIGGSAAISELVEAQVTEAASEVVNEDAQEIASATMSQLTTVTADGTMVFASSNPQLDDLVPGAVLASEPDATYEDGLFRLVTSVTEVAGVVTVETTAATVADVLPKGSVEITGTPDELAPTAPPFVQVSGGAFHTLGLTADGSLWAWGANEYGELGNGTSSGTPQKTPMRVGVGNDWRFVAAGDHYSLALKDDGSLWGWGSNLSGRVGLPIATTEVHLPTLISDAEWSHVSAYSEYSAGVREDGTLWTWGSDVKGQRGEGPAVAAPGMLQVGTDTDWSFVDVGRFQTLALKDDGELWAWGDAQFGQTGLGNTVTRHVPEQVGTDTWTDVSAGHWHSLGIKSDGTLWGWGDNNWGAVGDGTTTHRYAPVEVDSDTDWAEVETGDLCSAALKGAGERYAWGEGAYYGLALGDLNDRHEPTEGPEDFKFIALNGAGGLGVAGIDYRGQLWMAGQNDEAQLGDGSTTPRHEFERVTIPDDELATISSAMDMGGRAEQVADSGDLADPTLAVGSMWEGFVLRYYPGLNDWTFASWAEQNPGTYYGNYVEVEGHGSLDVSVYFNISTADWRVTGTDFYFYVEEGLSILVDTSHNGGSFSGEVTMWPFAGSRAIKLGTVAGTAGPVPFWVEFEVEVQTGISGELNAPAIHFRQYAGQTIGFSWDAASGAFSPINYGWNNNYCYGPRPGDSMSARAWTSAKLMARLYGVAGPYIKVTGAGELDANTAWNPWWKLELVLDGEVGAEFDYTVPVLDRHLYWDWHNSKRIISWTVARAPGAYPY